MAVHQFISCCLNHIKEKVTIDLPADMIPKDALINYSVCDESGKLPRVFTAEYVELPNGKFAYPVYENVEVYVFRDGWDFEDGTSTLIGWCVRDYNVFNVFKRFEW